MRLLWIGQDAGESQAGDAIYDRRMISEIRRLGHDVEVVSPRRVGRLAEAIHLLRGLPYYRARYEEAGFRDRLRTIAADFDHVICSWEPFDRHAALLGRPVLPILHNLTSQALPAMFPGRRSARLLAAGAARWERRLFATPTISGVGLLGAGDLDHVRRVAPDLPTLYLPPGLPTAAPLSADAAVRAEIWISGSHGWWPKRRDAIAFAREAVAAGFDLPVVADDLPTEAAALLRAGPPPIVDGKTIRFGLVTDRFTAGHKLKIGHYLAHGAIVLGFVDLTADFRDLPDHELFVRRIADIPDLVATVRTFERMDSVDLAGRLERFRRAAAERLSWTGSAARLVDFVQRNIEHGA